MNTAVIEKSFMETLNTVAALNLTGDEIKADPGLYNELAAHIYAFVSNAVVLTRRNRSRIRSTGIEYAEFCDDISLYLLDHLDAIFACPEERRIPLVMKMSNNKVVDKVRSWHRTYALLTFPEAPGAADTVEGGSVRAEQDWDMIASDVNLEEAFINREMALLALQIMACTAKPWEAVAFLATNILGWKTGRLAVVLQEKGHEQAMVEVLSYCSSIFGISVKIFSPLVERSCHAPVHFDVTDEKKLSSQLSRSAYNGKEAVKKAVMSRIAS